MVMLRDCRHQADEGAPKEEVFMTVWTALIIGLLIGWLVEWVIDWFYWRRRSASEWAELAELREKTGRMSADLETASRAGHVRQAQIVQLRNDLAAARAALGGQQPQADSVALQAALAEARAENERLRGEIDALKGSSVALGRARKDGETPRPGKQAPGA
jgi:hypothetical protein